MSVKQRYMWVHTEGNVHRRRKCFPVVATTTPGLVLLRYAAGLYRVTHEVSGFAMGPTLGLKKARQLVRQLAPRMDWTLPPEKLSAKYSRRDNFSDGELLRQQEIASLLSWWMFARNWRRRGYTRRMRAFYLKDERRAA
jgi:hypothetical protein